MQSGSVLKKYASYKQRKISYSWDKARRMKVCYLFLAPYAILFLTFFILPICTSIYYSFTSYNILEKPDFVGFKNYINLILQERCS